MDGFILMYIVHCNIIVYLTLNTTFTNTAKSLLNLKYYSKNVIFSKALYLLQRSLYYFFGSGPRLIKSINLCPFTFMRCRRHPLYIINIEKFGNFIF